MAILVHKDFTFIVQGITGREALNFTRECLEYGSRIVGGVTPGKGGTEVYGVPVCDTVREITAKTHVDGAVITVPLQFAARAPTMRAVTPTRPATRGTLVNRRRGRAVAQPGTHGLHDLQVFRGSRAGMRRASYPHHGDVPIGWGVGRGRGVRAGVVRGQSDRVVATAGGANRR
jgi:hypothetical protein